MKIRQTALAVSAAALLAFGSGCAVSDYPSYAGYDAYYYYPDYEVYYYPRVHQYWWRDGGEWRHGDRSPSHFVLRDRDRVRIDMDHKPHTDHARVRDMHPAHNQARNDADDRGAARSGAARAADRDSSASRGGDRSGGDRGGNSDRGGGNDSGRGKQIKRRPACAGRRADINEAASARGALSRSWSALRRSPPPR
jgi:hypothetical protein